MRPRFIQTYVALVHALEMAESSRDSRETEPDIIKTGEPGVYLARLRIMVASHTTLEYERVLHRSVICGIPFDGGYYGACMGDRIVIDNHLAPAEEFSVLAHEFSHFLFEHVTGTRLSYAGDWEAEAESVACLLCEAVGLKNGVEAATSYLLLWDGSLNHLKAAREFVLWGAQYVWDAIGPRQLQSQTAMGPNEIRGTLRMIATRRPPP